MSVAANTKWHELTWEEVGLRVAEGMDTAILPVGATEQHGPHMGCGMDADIARHLCEAVADQTGAVVLPTLPYGCSIGHSKRWPGTLALQPKTLIDVVKDLGDWIHASGFRRLFIVNSHVTNAAPLRCALEMLRAEHDGFMIALVNSASISERVRREHFHDAEDWHANGAETSLMMAVSPQMVREEKLAESDDEDRTTDSVFAHPVNRTSTNGVTGKPSLASKAKGEQLFQWMVEDLSEMVRKGMREESPLNVSYHETLEF
ncbi:MAG: creatininase family protein [Gammaproteobacteria bacterium]|nr:creatininase family protein [Gammaproteobacteria bacterium]